MNELTIIFSFLFFRVRATRGACMSSSCGTSWPACPRMPWDRRRWWTLTSPKSSFPPRDSWSLRGTTWTSTRTTGGAPRYAVRWRCRAFLLRLCVEQRSIQASSSSSLFFLTIAVDPSVRTRLPVPAVSHRDDGRTDESAAAAHWGGSDCSDGEARHWYDFLLQRILKSVDF